VWEKMALLSTDRSCNISETGQHAYIDLRMSNVRFRLVPNATTLDDLEGSLTHSVSKHVHRSHSVCF